MDLLTLGPSSLMIFKPPNIVLWILISSLSYHLLSTGRTIDSNLMPPIPKFHKISLIMTPFLVSTTGLMMVCTLFRVLQEIKEAPHQWKRHHLFDSVSSPSELDLFFDLPPSEELLN